MRGASCDVEQTILMVIYRSTERILFIFSNKNEKNMGAHSQPLKYP